MPKPYPGVQYRRVEIIRWIEQTKQPHGAKMSLYIYNLVYIYIYIHTHIWRVHHRSIVVRIVVIQGKTWRHRVEGGPSGPGTTAIQLLNSIIQ